MSQVPAVGQFEISGGVSGRMPVIQSATTNAANRMTMRRCFLIVYLRIIYLQMSASLGTEQSDDFVNAPDVIRNARFHCWRHAKRLMHPAEVVIHEV
jgi:hypothetical protein